MEIIIFLCILSVVVNVLRIIISSIVVSLRKRKDLKEIGYNWGWKMKTLGIVEAIVLTIGLYVLVHGFYLPIH